MNHRTALERAVAFFKAAEVPSRKRLGDLITCPYCIAWIASALVFAHQRAPRATRVLAGIFSITAASDFLNQLYAKVKE